MKLPRSREETILDEVALVALSLASVALLVLEVVGDTTAAQSRLLARIDVSIACIFLGEFTFEIARSHDRGAFLRKRWWELFACIPIDTDLAHAARGLILLRLVRVLRILRVARLAARIHLLIRESKSFLVDSTLLSITTSTAVIVFSAALGFHYFEFQVNPNVRGFWDSFWWAMTTVSTVGYGDIYPHTTGGRVIAILLMLTGIGTLGLYTAAIARYVLEQKR